MKTSSTRYLLTFVLWLLSYWGQGQSRLHVPWALYDPERPVVFKNLRTSVFGYFVVPNYPILDTVRPNVVRYRPYKSFDPRWAQIMSLTEARLNSAEFGDSLVDYGNGKWLFSIQDTIFRVSTRAINNRIIDGFAGPDTIAQRRLPNGFNDSVKVFKLTNGRVLILGKRFGIAKLGTFDMARNQTRPTFRSLMDLGAYKEVVDLGTPPLFNSGITNTLRFTHRKILPLSASGDYTIFNSKDSIVTKVYTMPRDSGTTIWVQIRMRRDSVLSASLDDPIETNRVYDELPVHLSGDLRPWIFTYAEGIYPNSNWGVVCQAYSKFRRPPGDSGLFWCIDCPTPQLHQGYRGLLGSTSSLMSQTTDGLYFEVFSTTDQSGRIWRNPALVAVSEPAPYTKPTINLYPNPTTNQIILSGLPDGHHNLTITDVFGKVISSKQVSNAEIIPLDLASGLYFYQVSGEKGRLVVR